jgi:predicted small metal-binding protein
MARYYIDCRDYPSIAKCSIALSADSKEELLEAAVHHTTLVHEGEDTPELREQLLTGIKEGTPAG